MCYGRLIINPSIPEDFDQVELNTNYQPDRPSFDLEYGAYVIEHAECCLTFSTKYDIIGIVGSFQLEHGVEIFAYLTPNLENYKTFKDLRFMRSLVQSLLGNRTGLMYVYNPKAERFARFLGFKDTGRTKELTKEYSNV